MRKLHNNTALLQKTIGANLNFALSIRNFTLRLFGYHDRGQEIGKYCPLPEPIRLQDAQDTARSRSKMLF